MIIIIIIVIIIIIIVIILFRFCMLTYSCKSLILTDLSEHFLLISNLSCLGQLHQMQAKNFDLQLLFKFVFFSTITTDLYFNSNSLVQYSIFLQLCYLFVKTLLQRNLYTLSVCLPVLYMRLRVLAPDSTLCLGMNVFSTCLNREAEV